ncbi:hypothetical protein [Xanthobacter pseudotagetidis]|uniref:hypothetical protein n=1 Tax=Xanthobacter pseudotagetidis TaxID=3119911 RepID=UPI00372B22C3
MARTLMIAMLALIAQIGTASACVTTGKEPGRYPYFYNGCRGPVIVKFFQNGGHAAMTGRIPVGGRYHVDSIVGRYSWCDVGDKHYWTCS